MDNRDTKQELQGEDWVTLNFKWGWRSIKESFTAQVAFDPQRCRISGPGLQEARAEPWPYSEGSRPCISFHIHPFDTPSCLCLNLDEILSSAHTQQRGSLGLPHSPTSVSPPLFRGNLLRFCAQPCRPSHRPGSGNGSGTQHSAM